MGRPGGPLLLGFQLLCVTEKGRTPWSQRSPSSAGLARAEHVTLQSVPGLECLACQGSSGSSRMVNEEQERPQSPCVGPWPQGVGVRGSINGTFVQPGAGEHMARARSVLHGHICPFLPWICPRPWPASQRGGLACQPVQP